MKKTKLALLTTLAATSAVVPTLSAVSCGRTQAAVNKVGEEFDKEYGINEAVYTKLKTEFVTAVGEQARQLGRNRERAQASARQACSAFDAEFKKNQNLSYTAVTNSLMEYASRTYNIKLTRKTQKKVASWDDLNIAFDGMARSMDSYMQSSGIGGSTRQVILKNARDSFNGENGLVSRIRANYADPLLGLMHAKGQLLSCFADVNEDIGLVASANRLKDFMSDYSIDYDFNKADNSNKLDKLEGNAWFKVGADLSENSNILKIFTITRKSDGKPLDKFEASRVCPGYTIKPILKKVNKDPRRNEYSLDIDWTAVKTSYLTANDTERAEKTTAHYYKPSYQDIDTSDTSSAYKMLKKANESSSLNHTIYLSKEGERTALENTYFNKGSNEGYISFDWDDDANNNAFDALFSGTPLESKANGESHEYIVDYDALAKSGLRLSFNGATKETNRLDKLVAVSGVNSETSEKLLKSSALVQDFIDNCTVWGDAKPQQTQVTNSGTYSSINSVYVDYCNTKYKQEFTGDNRSHCEIYENEYTNKFVLSKNSYDYLTGEFNQQKDFLNHYLNNEYEDEYNSVIHDVVLQSLFLSLTVLFTIQTTGFCFVPVFAAHIPIYIVLLVLSWISMGGQIAILGLLIDKKLLPIKRFKEDCDGIKNSKVLKQLDQIITQSQNNNHLCRYNEDYFIKKEDYDAAFQQFQGEKTDFFNQVLPAMKFYQNINSNTEFQQLLSLIKTANVDPQTYSETMSVWDKDGKCQKATIGLIVSTVALDIITTVLMCITPEMSDWQLVKLVAADAQTSGKSFKSMMETYKSIIKMRNELKVINQALKDSGATLGNVAKVKGDDITKLFTSTITFKEYGNLQEKTYEFMKDFGEWCAKSAFGLGPEDLNKFSSTLMGLITSDKAGFSAIARNLTLDMVATRTGAGEQCIARIVRNLQNAVNGTIKEGEEIAISVKNVRQVFEGLALNSDRLLVKNAALAAENAMRQGKLDEVFAELKKIDEIIFDVSKWDKNVLNYNQSCEMLYQAARCGEFSVYSAMNDLKTLLKAGHFTVGA